MTRLIYTILVLLFCGCTNSKDSALPKSSKKTIVLATNSEPDTLNPLFAEMAASFEVIMFGHRELTMNDDSWKLIPDLAREVPTVENGQVKTLPGGEMQVTWHIKESAKWEDGVPVTGEDVAFAWKVCLDPTQEIIDRDTCGRVKSIDVDKTNKKTFIVTWKQAFAFFNNYRIHPLLPAHVLANRYRTASGGSKDLKKDPYGSKPLSNGPFKFKEWVPGQYITYVRNDLYEPKAKIDEVVIRIIPNNQSIESNLAAGSIDGVTPAGGLSVPQIESLRKRHGDKLSYYSVPGMVWSHVDFNLDSNLLSDVKVRRALAHAINRQKIIDSIYHGQYQIANTFMAPKHWAFNPKIPAIEFDLKKAAQLLDEAGFKQPAPGQTRVNAKGEKLLLKMSAVAGVKDIEQCQQVFQSDLKGIGVELQIDNKPAKVFFGKMARYREFPHMSFYAWLTDPGNWGLTLWHKDYIPSKKNNWLGQNYPGWKNDEASALLEKIPSELTFAKRKAMVDRVQELWFEALPTIPMYFRPEVSVTKKSFKNFRPTGTQTPISWNSAEWS